MYIERNDLKIHHSFILYAVSVLCMLFIASPLQYLFGIWGLAATEIMFAIISFTAAFIWKLDFTVMLPVKALSFKEVSGSLLVYSGSYMLLIVLSNIISMFIPDPFNSVQTIESTMTSLGAAPAVLVMGFLPAICEETLFRGAMLYPLRNFKHMWNAIIVSGIMFGVFHLDPYRLPMMTALGVVFAYIFLKTENILIPMAAHFINNCISILAVIYSSAEIGGSREISIYAYAGSLIIIFGIGAILLYFGVMNINRRKYGFIRVFVPALISVLIIAAGVFIAYL